MSNVLTEKEFLLVYNKYKLDFFTKFMYKYFSVDKKCLGTKILISYVVIFNLISIILDNMNEKSYLILPIVLLANIPFFTWGILGIIAFTLNRKRHNKIKNELGIKTIEEYNQYISLYLNKD